MAFKAGNESVKAARDFTARTLREWHLDSLIDDGVIIASELVTNAIRHGSALADPDDPPAVELAWQRFSSRVTCVVTDGSTTPPVLNAPDMSSESGRGLQVVNALAAAWGWMMLGSREKAVWATMILPSGSLLLSWFVTTSLAGGAPAATAWRLRCRATRFDRQATAPRCGAGGRFTSSGAPTLSLLPPQRRRAAPRAAAYTAAGCPRCRSCRRNGTTLFPARSR
jgi:anti-sigma regulatory factor (Ser/Thr protein kinase)